MICETCRTELPDHAVACYRCGTVLDEITFVKPLGGERVREVYVPPVERSNRSLIIAIGIAAVLFAGLVAGLVSFAFNRNRELAAASPIPTPAATTPEMATPTPTPKPSATKFVQIEPSNSNSDVRAGMPTVPPEDATALCTDGTYTKWVHTKKACSANGGVAKWYVSGIDNSRKARAICEDGHVSYFDGPRLLVCATGGGVRHWYY